MKYALYQPNGKIVSLLSCREEDLVHNLAGLNAIEANIPNTVDYYIANDLVVTKDNQPSIAHVFDYDTKTWVDPRTLLDMKALKWAEIKQARDLAEFGSFSYTGMEFDGDVDAQRRLAGYISISKGALAAGTAFEAPFTLANNTEVLLTAQDFVGIELAKVTSVATAFAQAAALRLLIDGATSVEQLAQINWNSQV